ncbi:hypothetical protein [Sporomusa acidovorans]|uniref:Uncharacterized protein n=1 Tax=Sporomusa acidovorans (strain ATCC 49682 / DSM 3132 / Mol) TaxID=1123286 RepID=A0ABZ3J904_SPOA4|nr:hypothetical protein [Sporomusa acidovorans]OZC16030.1 hypothetical protein SPACI_43960 [Sporomusa acidovorans DSM 3132]SDD89184.1 hypothetical protein SAMN04488499_1005101 [Sporomusa acidovorans]
MHKRDPIMKQVQKYLYSIKRSEIKILNLERAIQDLDTRRESPPVWMHDPDTISVTGGQEGSKQESWVEFLEAYPGRRSYLTDCLEQEQKRVEQFYQTLDQLSAEGNWGPLAANIIRHKYIQRITPDTAIYTMFLFCTKESFYRTHKKALKFFYDVLPDVFQNDTFVTLNLSKNVV